MQPTGGKNSNIGYWMSDKKCQKLNMQEFRKASKSRGYDVVKLDLSRSLEEQGPFSIIFHKCSDIIVKANGGDVKSQQMIKNLENYLIAHPELPIIDPLDKVRRLLDRYRWYLAIWSNPALTAANIFTPTSVELTSNDPSVNLAALKNAGVRFPFVCKPSVGHGSSEAHDMSIIFNEAGVADCKPPAVAQTFINHNALLYKIYIIGDNCEIFERPSLKNFYSIENERTIFFSSVDVSKPDSTSTLNILDNDDPMRNSQVQKLDPHRLKILMETINSEIGLQLLGLDIVVENGTGRYAIIDLNHYPGYDGFPNYYESTLDLLENAMKEHKPRTKSSSTGTPDAVSPTGENFRTLTRIDHEDSGFDTSDSSDEKKKQLFDSF